MSLKLNSSGGGSVTLQEPATASNVTLNLPAATGTVIYSDASGNVGIGTSSPATKADIVGASGVTSFTGTSFLGLQVRGATSTNDYSGIGFSTNGQGSPTAKIGAYFSGNGSYLQFGTSNSYGSGVTNTAMTIDFNGNVGIGTSSPSALLNSSGTLTSNVGTGSAAGFVMSVNGTPTGFLGSSANGTTLDSRGATFIAFQTNSTERARIDSSGNLNLATGGSALQWSNSGNNCYIAASSGILQFATGTAGYSERMRIDASGNLLVGQTAQSAVSNGAYISNVANGSQFYSGAAATTNATSSYLMYSTGASAYRFYVGWGGTISATSSTITAISDQRLKENIRDLDEGLDVVLALKPRKFDWKEGKGANIKNARGFIAQEFEQVLPDMIEEWLDPAPEGEEPYKGVNANLIPTLVKAIQEQQAMIEELKAKVADMAPRLAALEAK